VVLGDALEAMALRAVLERFNFRVEVHWVGSRKEMLEILSGRIETSKHVIISCHGAEKGINVPEEKPISPSEIQKMANLKGKIVVNLGCLTGKKEYAQAFLEQGKVVAYIAPTDHVHGNSALMFAIRLFYELGKKKSLQEAVKTACGLDKRTGLFKLLVK
jgi:hypothetical protein